MTSFLTIMASLAGFEVRGVSVLLYYKCLSTAVRVWDACIGHPICSLDHKYTHIHTNKIKQVCNFALFAAGIYSSQVCITQQTHLFNNKTSPSTHPHPTPPLTPNNR